MIKLIIFDLDGVLVDTRSIHYLALNEALGSYAISLSDHLSVYDGLPTREKLRLLSERNGLPYESHDEIWRKKQLSTMSIISRCLIRDDRLCNILKKLRNDGYKLYVASNSIRDSIRLMLCRSGLMEYIDYYISSEDVVNCKPHSEMYLRCLVHAGVNPDECLIVEDSPVGRRSALSSGCHVLCVDSPLDVSYEKIANFGKHDLTILIPMAGAGKRFNQAGYIFPKPLISIHGKPMIQIVLDNIGVIDANYIFVVQKEHYDSYNLKYLLNLLSPNCEIVLSNGLTDGAACTTLLAEKFIDNDNNLLIINSDQFIEWGECSGKEFIFSMISQSLDGGIITFNSVHPKWSFVKLDNGLVVEVAEKKPISDIANCGIYWWRHGSDYIKYTKDMINKNIRTNGEYFVAPVFNEFINNGGRIGNFPIKKMWSLGTPEDLEFFIQNFSSIGKL